MIFSQNPSVLSNKIDADAISKSWPRSEELTVRAVQEQVKFFRKEIQKVQSGKGATPSTPGSKTFTSTPRKTTTPASVTPSKRANGINTRTPTSSCKKRKLSRNKKDSDESDEDPVLSSEASAPDANDTDEDDSPLAKIPTAIERRTLPARSKSRSKSYVAESDSGEPDAGAKDPDSEIDSEFSISKMNDNERTKGRNAVGTLLKGMLAKESVVNGDGDSGETRADNEQEDVAGNIKTENGDSDADSGTTSRTS